MMTKKSRRTEERNCTRRLI